jgi:hypothetical protein
MPEMQGVPFDKLRGEAVVVYADPLTGLLPLPPTFGWGQGKLSENDNILTGTPPDQRSGGGASQHSRCGILGFPEGQMRAGGCYGRPTLVYSKPKARILSG